jgi:hypothetical protein
MITYFIKIIIFVCCIGIERDARAWKDNLDLLPNDLKVNLSRSDPEVNPSSDNHKVIPLSRNLEANYPSSNLEANPSSGSLEVNPPLGNLEAKPSFGSLEVNHSASDLDSNPLHEANNLHSSGAGNSTRAANASKLEVKMEANSGLQQQTLESDLEESGRTLCFSCLGLIRYFYIVDVAYLNNQDILSFDESMHIKICIASIK